MRPAGLAASLRAVWRLARVLLHAGHGLLLVLLRWPALDAAAREARIAWWAGKMLRLFGIRHRVQGGFRSGATLLLCNHVSWLDILAVHAACPQARFVSKADVHHWPMVGRLAGAAGTLFIERERKRDALRVVHQMAEALGRGETVAVFPEGTTGDGRALLPFHANLLQAAIASGTPMQPVALRYREPGADPSTAVAWVGTTTLWANLWAVLCAEQLSVQVTVLPPMVSVHGERRALVQRVEQAIAEALGERAPFRSTG